MRRTTLLPLLLLIIFVILTLTMTACSSRNYETNTYEVNEEFSSISIKTDTADITFVPSDNGICKVSCFEDEKKWHAVEVRDGILFINVVDEKEWYEYIGLNIDNPKVTVYLPKAEYSSLVIKEDTGDIEIAKDFNFEGIDLSLSTGNVKLYASCTEDAKIVSSTGNIYINDISTGSLDISVSTGKVTVSGVTCNGNITVVVSTGKANLTNTVCRNLISRGSTGDILLKNVIATEKISIERSTGDVKFEGSDGAEIFVTTDTGDVEGSLLTDKVFITKTDTGRIRVPGSTSGGRCEITTDTGNIKITILED